MSTQEPSRLCAEYSCGYTHRARETATGDPEIAGGDGTSGSLLKQKLRCGCRRGPNACSYNLPFSLSEMIVHGSANLHSTPTNPNTLVSCRTEPLSKKSHVSICAKITDIHIMYLFVQMQPVGSHSGCYLGAWCLWYSVIGCAKTLL